MPDLYPIDLDGCELQLESDHDTLYISGPKGLHLCIDYWHVLDEEGDGCPLVVLRHGLDEGGVCGDPVAFVRWKPDCLKLETENYIPRDDWIEVEEGWSDAKITVKITPKEVSECDNQSGS